MRGVGAEVSTACSEHGDSGTSKAIWMRCLGMSGSAPVSGHVQTGAAWPAVKSTVGEIPPLSSGGPRSQGRCSAPGLHLDSAFPSCALAQSETLWGRKQWRASPEDPGCPHSPGLASEQPISFPISVESHIARPRPSSALCNCSSCLLISGRLFLRARWFAGESN